MMGAMDIHDGLLLVHLMVLLNWLSLEICEMLD
jgi:hypothetical protein